MSFLIALGKGLKGGKENNLEKVFSGLALIFESVLLKAIKKLEHIEG